MQGIEIPIGAPLGPLNDDLKGAEKKLKGFTNAAEKDLKSFSSTASSTFKSVGLAFAGAFTVGAFVSFGKEVLAVTAEFEKFGAVLGNTLGSDALAKLKLKEISDFAAKTPFSVNELTDSFIKLANQGFKPTGDEMRSLGDLASSTGKSFNQLAEAILDAQTGEFERLKEFGVRAQASGDKVIFTFKGVQTIVDKSSEAIRGYVLSLGNAEGVSGSMAVISETLTGKISNLGDSWDQMLVSVGSNTSGVFTSAIDLISQAINKVTDFNKSLNTVSKFKLKSDWGEKLNRAINPFAEKGSTSTEKAIYAIKQADIEVTKFVSGALAGAKSTSDFGTAIADLQKKGNAMIADFKMFAPQGLAGIKTTYEDGIKALKEGRTAFEIESKKGTPAKINLAAEKKSKADAAKLLKEARDNAAQLKIDAGKFNQQMMSSLMNFQANAALAADEAKLKLNFIDPDAIDAAVSFAENAAKRIVDAFAPIKGPQQQKFIEFQFPSIQEKSALVIQELLNFNSQASEIINNGLVQTFAGIGNAIGDSLANGTNLAQNLGASLLNSLSSVLSQLGQLAIATAVGIEGIKISLRTLNPGPALVAGIALLALAGGVRALGNKVGGSGGAGNKGGGNFSAPIPQASSTISTSAAGSAQDFGGGRVVFEISGTNLIGVLNRAGAKLQRFGP